MPKYSSSISPWENHSKFLKFLVPNSILLLLSIFYLKVIIWKKEEERITLSWYIWKAKNQPTFAPGVVAGWNFSKKISLASVESLWSFTSMKIFRLCFLGRKLCAQPENWQENKELLYGSTKRIIASSTGFFYIFCDYK